MRIVVHAIFTQSSEFMAIRLSNYIHKSLFFILFFGIEAPRDFFLTISRWSIEMRWKKGNCLVSKFEIWWRFDFHYTNVFISLWQLLPSSQIYKCREQCKNNSSEKKKPQQENLVKSLVRARYGVHECSAKEFSIELISAVSLKWLFVFQMRTHWEGIVTDFFWQLTRVIPLYHFFFC